MAKKDGLKVGISGGDFEGKIVGIGRQLVRTSEEITLGHREDITVGLKEGGVIDV